MLRLLAFFLFFLALVPFVLSQEASHPLLDSAQAYVKQANFPKADAFLARLKEQLHKEGKSGSLLFADVESQHAFVLNRLMRVPEAEKAIRNGLGLHRKWTGDTSLATGKDLFLLGGLEGMKNENARADSLFQLVLPIFSAHYPENDMEMAKLYINIGSVWMIQNVAKAESNLLKGLAIAEKLDPRSQFAANGHNNLGKLYGEMGESKKELFHIRRGLEIMEEASGGRHPYLGLFYQNLSAAYGRQKQFAEAERLGWIGYRKLLATFGDKHPAPGISLTQLATYAYFNHNYFAAIQHFRKAEKLLRISGLDPGQPRVLYGALLAAFAATGQIKEEDSCYQKGRAEIDKYKHQDPLGFYSHRISMNRATSLRNRNQGEEAEVHFREAGNCIVAQLTHYFPFLSDNGKARFVQLLESDLEMTKSFFLFRSPTKPALADELYNMQLATKALLLNSTAKWKQRIKTSGDLKLIQLYGRWADNQSTLSKLYRESTTNRQLDSCLALNESLEKELSRRSENFARLSERTPATWKQVQAKLKAGEAAAEVIRMKAYGRVKTITDTSDPRQPRYPVYGFQDSVFYAVLLVKPGIPHPEVVFLPRGNYLEKEGLRFYRKCIERKLPDTESYNRFWKHIGKHLSGIRRLYFSPEGVFHSLNLNTLQNPQTGKFLLEEMEISQVTTTRDLLVPQKEPDMNQLAYLVGFPNYDTPVALRHQEIAKLRNSPELGYSLPRLRGEGFSELPGTKVEVEGIARLLEAKGWEVNTLKGDKALEETVKESLKPRVLHLATHGFFDPDTTPGSNPLLHSGLLLAGANRSFSGEKSEKTEDGILTAYEAMNLNLDNTDLVVLSACETGLGEIKNGEGVYGLQRAFKVAGARSLIMSLWKVDDEATQELMVSFYKNWLSNPNGTKRAAFLKAQKELKAKYPQPYFWGAFVMVGE